MIYLVSGLILFWLFSAGLKAFAKANPAQLARLIRSGMGGAALLAAGFLLLRGRVDVAIGLGGLGAWLLGWSSFSPLGIFNFARPKAAKDSCVRSAMIEMELDHQSGKMRGTVLAGPDEGRTLDSMTRPQCEALFHLCRRDDPDGARLLEAYFDRRFSGWRPAGQGQRDSGSAGRSAAMSKDEAYQVLGLQEGASPEEVVRSHRSLMKKLHPDHGGTTALAARVNEAKEVLMRRHQ
jgi:hypothetical protein